MSMFRKFIFVVIPLCTLLTVCRNISDVKPTPRTTFIKIYEKGSNYSAEVAEPISGGFIIGSNLDLGIMGTTAFITQTDLYGNVVKEAELRSYSVTAIKVVSDGYLIFGDSIQVHPFASDINDRTVTSSKVIKMNSALGITRFKSFYNPADSLEDFHGTGINIDASGNIVTVGTKKTSSSSSFFVAYVAVYTPQLDTIWTRNYSLLDNDFQNAKNAYSMAGGNVLWSSSQIRVVQQTTYSYLSLPSADSAGVYTSYDKLGQSNTNNQLLASEMQAGTIGYGIIGTLSDQQGNNGNLFFVTATADGTFQPSSILVIDGSTLDKNGVVATSDPNSLPPSPSDDLGVAICPTQDGGYLLGGSTKTTLTRGYGPQNSLNSWLIRVDANSQVVWNKIYGGDGDETVNSVRALEDGSFLVAGSSVTNSLSSAFLMRVDANGNITN